MSKPTLSLETMSGGQYRYSIENLGRLFQAIEEARSLALPLIIAIDGSAAVGKTQIARMLEFFGYQQMSKGLLSRVFTWVWQEYHFAKVPIEEFVEVCRRLEIKPSREKNKNVIVITDKTFGSSVLDPDGYEAEDGLRSDRINQQVSGLSGQTEIVNLIHELVEEIARQAAQEGRPLVIDGRDSVWTFQYSEFPVAIAYLYAQEAIIRSRAGERYKKLHAKVNPGKPLDPEEERLAGQKAIDRTREDMQKSDGRLASLEEAYKMLEDGLYDEVIDTTEMSVFETLFHVLVAQLKVLELWLSAPSNHAEASFN